jgi:sec-independent protein translocase protein TatC
MQSPPTDKSMTFWEHLDELRLRIRRALIGFVLCAVAAWYAREHVLTLLVYPFRRAWVQQNIPGVPELHFAAPSDAFMAYVHQSMIAGAVVAGPYIFWQLWAFIAPGLYKKEKKTGLLFVFCSTLLFAGGGLFAWYVAFPIAFSYFLSLSGDLGAHGVAITPTVMMTDYLDFVGRLLLAFGVIFEIPVVSLFLSAVGLINYKQMWRFGKWFVLIAFTFGAVLTPPDVTSQLVMAIPMCLLYLVSIGLAYVFGRKPFDEEAEGSGAKGK